MAGLALSIPRSLDALFDLGVVGDMPDGQLIERFTARPREAAELAFHALVERHGPMVLSVCRRLLDDPNDAEDAFQATFLVLLRRAASIRDRGSVASWLHGVALRVASRARVESARRRRIERHGVRPESDREDHAGRLDLETLIDEELTRLPEKYRAPVVLCYLEGMTHEGAAARLGWPVGTVRGRLSRARDLLRTRLTRRGVTAPAAIAAIGGLLVPARAAVPAALGEATVRAAAEIASGRMVVAAVSARVAAWVHGTARGLALHRLKAIAGPLIVLGTVGTGLAILAAPPSTPPTQQAEVTRPPDSREAIRRELLQLKGTWATTTTVEEAVNGVPRPPRKVKMIWSIDRDTITEAEEDGFAGWTYRFSVDPERSPGTIHLKSLNNEMRLRGVYTLEGDTLTITYGLERPGGQAARPDELRHVFHRESRTPAKLSPRFPTAEGCYWALAPVNGAGLPTSMASGNLNVIIKKAPDEAMLITLAYMSRLVDGEPDVEYRPVVFDINKKRHTLPHVEGGWSTSGAFPDIVLAHPEFRLDPAVLPFARVTAMGIEVVPAEVRRADELRASENAIQQARDAGIDILPRPEVGKPFAFSLTDTKGRVIRSSELKGKVVLIDWWASWSGSTTNKLPRLKALYDRRRGDGLEIIGLNFDRDRGSAEHVVKALALTWPQVFVPADDRTRRLWKEGPGLPSYPRSLLIDRQGVLRWDGRADDLEARINDLLK